MTMTKAPKLLYGYLATEMVAPFFASFMIINCVFFLVKLIPFLNFVLELNIDVADFGRLFAYLFPNIFLFSIPMAAMMGVTIGFARLSSDSEILALKASGISMFNMLPPVIIVTTIIALLTCYFSVRLIPYSEIAMKQLTYQLLKEKVNKGIKPHVFTEALGDVVIYIGDIDKETEQWQDVWVSDMRGVETPTITLATSGYMESSKEDMMVTITLTNGSLHRPSNTTAQIVEFNKYQIKVPIAPQESKATRVKKRTVLSMQQLLEEANAIDENNVTKRQYLIEFHNRLVLPAGCLLISLIGLPLGLQARPGKKAIGIQSGLVIFILYYILYTFGRTMAEEDSVPIVLGMWAPNFLFFCLALFWIYRVANEKSLVPDSLKQIYGWGVRSIWHIIQYTYKKVRSKLLGQSEEEMNESDSHALPIKGNAKSKVFHVPECEFYGGRNCTIEFKNIQIALDSDFEPCRFCKDLMDLDR